jgi:hypothetical protein
MHCIVYGLASTRDGKIRYIGQTRRKPEARLTQHIAEAYKANPIHPRLAEWIRAENKARFFVGVRVLDERGVWNETEPKLIAEYRARGENLLNKSKGGDAPADMDRANALRVKTTELRRYRRVETRDRIQTAPTAPSRPIQ